MWPIDAFDPTKATSNSVVVKVPVVFGDVMKQQVTLSFRPVTASYVRKGFGWQFFFTEAVNSHPYVTLPGLDPRSTYEVRLLLGNGLWSHHTVHRSTSERLMKVSCGSRAHHKSCLPKFTVLIDRKY